MTGTSAGVWGEVRRRAALEPSATWRVAVCARGCLYARVAGLNPGPASDSDAPDA